MKANGTKRKIFSDAVDLLAGAEEVSAVENGIRMLPIDSIRPFRKHPFRLYEGECIIFHKHRASQPYHQHGRARNLGQAVRSIMGHDVFQMNGRKSV